jgi:transmembrane sensor
MSELPVPIRDALAEPDDLAVERVLQGWRARRDARRIRTTVVGAGAMAVAAAVCFAVIARRPVPVGPLLRDDGALPRAVESGAVARLLDRSEVSVRGGRVVVLGNTARSFETRLDGGRARFSVTPGGPRRWSVTCEGVVVDVTGTVFEVEREPTAVRVSVERGAVRVTSRRLRGPRAVTAGQWVRVPLVDDAPRPPAATPAPTVAVEPPAPLARTAPPAPSRPTPAWRDLARQGAYDQAWQQLGVGGVTRVERSSSAADLLELADVARLSGHPAEAVSPLERVLREHAGDPAAPLAAFALGRLQLDALGRPDRAAEALERALALGVARSLEDDVRARLVEALARSGRRDAMRAAATEYLRRFPDGRRAAAVRRRLEAP